MNIIQRANTLSSRLLLLVVALCVCQELSARTQCVDIHTIVSKVNSNTEKVAPATMRVEELRAKLKRDGHITLFGVEIDALLTDLDDSAADTGVAVYNSWFRFSKRHDLDPDEVFAKMKGSTRETMEFFKELKGKDYDIDEEMRIFAEEQRNDDTGVKAIPGVHEFHRLFRKSGVPIAVVTGSTEEQAIQRMRLAKIEKPDALVHADHIGEGKPLKNGKPSPESFLYGAKLLGVDISRCLAIEDTESGIQAALAAGVAMVIAIGEKPSQFDTHFRVKDYYELMELAGLHEPDEDSQPHQVFQLQASQPLVGLPLVNQTGLPQTSPALTNQLQDSPQAVE